MILTAYNHFKEFEISLSFEKTTYITENFQNIKTGSSEIDFKAIKLELESDIKEKLGIVDGGCELLVKADSDIMQELKKGSKLKCGSTNYIIEKSEPLDYSDCHSFFCREEIYGT